MPHKRAKASIRKAESLRKGFDLPPNQLQHANKKNKRKAKHSSTPKAYQIDEDIPKNMFRILNAEKIRAEYKIRKTQNDLPLGNGTNLPSNRSSVGKNSTGSKRRNQSTKASKTQDELKILPGEGLGSFNRRVEATLRPKVTAVMKAAKNQLKTNKADSHQKQQQPSASSKTVEKKKEVEGEGQGKEGEESTEQEQPKAIKHFAPRPSRFPITQVAMQPPTLSLTKSMKKIAASDRCSPPLPISLAQKRSLELEREKVIVHYRLLKEERYAKQNL